MKSFLDFTDRHPIAYYALCCVFGMAIRLWMAHGDWGLFFNPLFPLFR